MGKKRTKREKNFPKHVVTGVAVTSLAFGVLTNAAGFENLFEPQSYKKFEKQLDKKSDYVSGKGKNTDLADQKNPNQKNSGNDLQQAMKLSGDQMKTSSQKSDMNLSSSQNSDNNAQNANTFSVSDTDGTGTVDTNTNPGNSSDTNGNDSSDSQKPGTSDSNQKPSSDNSSDTDDKPSTPDTPSSDDDSKTTTWEEEQLKPKDQEETKYGKITKLTAKITKEEYSMESAFDASDAVVTGTFIKDGKTYTQELPYGGEDGYKISFSTKKVGTHTAVISFGGLTTRAAYKVLQNSAVVNFFVFYNNEYYGAQFNGKLFDFLTEDVQDYLSSLNKIPYTYPCGGTAINLEDMHSRMIAYLLDNQVKESLVKFDGSYPNVNFLEESSDGYLKTMLEGFRFCTDKKLIDSKSYIYYPADTKSWNYAINTKQLVDVMVSVPDDFKIKRVTQSEDDWKSYRADQVLEQYLGTDENLCVPMGVTKVQLTKKPANANVTTLTLPESVNQVDAASIAEYIPSLQEYAYTDPDDSCSISYRNYKIIDGVLYSKDGTTLLSVPAGRTKKLVIPSTVTTLAKGCFKNVSLDKIYFEDSSAPVCLGDTGYHGTIVVPESTYNTACKKYIFAFSNESTNIDFVSEDQQESLYSYDADTNTICKKDDPETLCGVPSDAKGLYSVDSKYKTIEAGAFYGNTSITDIELGRNITKLNNNSLAFSSNISSISSTSSKLQIDANLFGDPSDGAKVPDIKFYVYATDYEHYLKEWSDILDPVYGSETAKGILSTDNGTIIYEDGAKYERYKEGSNTYYRLLKVYENSKTAFKIKDGTTKITNGALDECSKLEILYLPSDLQSFDSELLNNCNALETVINTAPSTKVFLPDASDGSVFNIGVDYQEFTYDDGIVYGKTLDGSYTLLNVPTDYSGLLNLKNNTTKLYNKALSGCTGVDGFNVLDDKALTEIGAYCFEGCTFISFDASKLTNLNLIGKAAFKDCIYLNSIYLPDQLQTFEDQTFYGCTSLKKISANGITAIKNEVFAECIELSELAGFNSLETIGDLAFYDCLSVDAIVLPDSVSKIGEECFENCLNLYKIVLNGDITAISRYCFYGCQSLTTIEISEKTKNTLKVIGAEAFAECSTLKNPDFSEVSSLTLIGKGAFKNCNELVSIKLPQSLEKLTTDTFSGCNNLSALQLNSENVTAMEGSVFGDTIPHYLHILVNESALDSYQTAYQTTLDKTYGSGTTKNVLRVIDPNTEYINGIRYELTENGRILKEAPADFEGEFTVLEDTIKIDDDAFNGCTKITKLIIPSKATVELGKRCFKDCTSLEGVYIYGNIPSWEEETFMGCSSLQKATIGTSVSTIPRIGTRAFKGCSGLSAEAAVSIYALVNTIGQEAFMDCTNLPSIGYGTNGTLGEARAALQIIEDSAFCNCTKLKTFLTTKFSGVTTLGDYVFKGCLSMTAPSLAASVTSIGKGCFMDCANLSYVSIYGAVKEYPDDCFKNCPKLQRTGGTALAFASLQKIGDGAYEGCTSLSSATASWYLERYSNLKEIGDNAFKGCKTLLDTKLSATVTAVGSHAFDGCTNMKSLTFKGTTPPQIGAFSPETMADGFLLKVPDSKEQDDKVYKDYFERLKDALGSSDKVYPILDSVSDGAKDRNTPQVTEETETDLNTEDNSQNNEEINK